MDHELLALLAKDRTDELVRAARPRGSRGRRPTVAWSGDRDRAGLLQWALRRTRPGVQAAPC